LEAGLKRREKKRQGIASNGGLVCHDYGRTALERCGCLKVLIGKKENGGDGSGAHTAWRAGGGVPEDV